MATKSKSRLSLECRTCGAAWDDHLPQPLPMFLLCAALRAVRRVLFSYDSAIASASHGATALARAALPGVRLARVQHR